MYLFSTGKMALYGTIRFEFYYLSGDELLRMVVRNNCRYCHYSTPEKQNEEKHNARRRFSRETTARYDGGDNGRHFPDDRTNVRSSRSQ